MSSIFLPYRALGLCASDVPFVVRYAAHSHTYYALVPVGESFNVYKLPRLTLVAISDPCPTKIRAFTSSEQFVFASAGSEIYVFRNSRYLLHKIGGHHSSITHLLVFSGYLASLDQDGLLVVRTLTTFDTVFSTRFEPNSFKISVIFSPVDYVNKLLLGSFQGPLQLWNVKSQKQLCWFKGFQASVTCITQAPAIDVCAIGLSDGRIILHNIRYDSTIMSFCQDGGAVTALCFRSDVQGFSRAANAENPLPSDDQIDVFMISGSLIGQVTCWQLRKNGESRPIGHTTNMHWERINQMFCIPSGDAAGAMVTSGSDNSIKVSYFDRADGGPRTVYKRSGHFRPPNRVAFWPGGLTSGSLLLSAGQDSMLRIFSTFNEHLDKSLGRAYAPGVPDRRKSTTMDRSSWLLPGITQLYTCASRADDWDSVVAIHEGTRQATTWNFVNATRGKYWLDPAKFRGKGGLAIRLYKHAAATSVFITNCGNYVLIGYSTGDVVKFNLQSGIEQGQYGDPTAHSSPVVGVSVNQVNRQTATVGGTEVRFWSFHKRELLHSVTLVSPALFSRFNGESDTLAVALTDGTIILFDVTHRRVIRRFNNPNSQQCVDLVISTDGRWIISAHHGDPLIKTWDVVYGKLIDCFRVNTPITSLALSPSGEFLATTHSNSLGVHLWDNSGTYRRLNLQPLPDDFSPPVGQDPTPIPSRSLVLVSHAGSNTVQLSLSVDERNEEEFGISDIQEPTALSQLDVGSEETHSYNSPDQLPDQLATLSGLPISYINSFVYLDRIRARNRLATSTESNQSASQLPFFLPVMETEKGLAWADQDDPDTNESPGHSRALKRRAVFGDDLSVALEPVPGLMAKLAKAVDDKDFDDVMQVLKTLGPSALDLEIRLLVQSNESVQSSIGDASVVTSVPTSLEHLHGFLRLLINRFDRNLDIDLACICLENVLQRHGDLIRSPTTPSSVTDLTELLDEIRADPRTNMTRSLFRRAVEAQSNIAQTLARRLTRSICLTDFVRNPTTTLNF